jgi:nicotinate-nucleotide pyrophosphorylase (carboxylating)
MLHPLLFEDILRAALREDIGRAGDITTAAIIGPAARMRAVFRARKPGTIAGLPIAEATMRLLDPALGFRTLVPDGAQAEAGAVLAAVEGNARAILAAERTALNLLSHLSGIATATREVVEAVRPHRPRIACTRKTLPGLRGLQKYAVRQGGGANHRFGLDDAMLIKDNHIALAGGIAAAMRQARDAAGHMVRIQVEVESPAGAEEAVQAGADAILLDNMAPDAMRQIVARHGAGVTIEASGGITPASAAAVAASGVHVISLGWLTHSVRALDIGLDADAAGRDGSG